MHTYNNYICMHIHMGILGLLKRNPQTPCSITSHSVLRGHPSLTHQVGFFRGIQWGIRSQKIILGTAICFLRKYAFRMKNPKHTHTHYIYKFIVFIMCNYCYMYGNGGEYRSSKTTLTFIIKR